MEKMSNKVWKKNKTGNILLGLTRKLDAACKHNVRIQICFRIQVLFGKDWDELKAYFLIIAICQL